MEKFDEGVVHVRDNSVSSRRNRKYTAYYSKIGLPQR